MKKKYQNILFEVIEFDLEDIVTGSDGNQQEIGSGEEGEVCEIDETEL